MRQTAGLFVSISDIRIAVPLVSIEISNTSATSPPIAGRARLRFSRSAGHTILDRSFATSPVKVFTTRGVGATCWLYSATLGGGIVGGDDLQIDVEVAAGARALIATQASTKVYRSLRPACQRVIASVADDALLAIVPDPVVCFAGADFSQHQRYDLAGGASLVLVDWITSGRHATGERWEFRRYASRIDLYRDGTRVLYDGVLLDQDDGSIGERLARFNVCLTTVVTGPLVSDEADHLIRAVSQLPIEPLEDFVIAAWPLSGGGALLRMSGTSVEQVGARLRECLAFLGPLLGDDPWTRKW